jgi:hypothetical protein
MKPRIAFAAAWISAFSALALQPLRADQTLALKREFVDRIRDRATISVNLHVDKHPPRPHGISRGAKDGDIHMAGRADEVGLPMVAEIINARLESDALAQLKKAKGDTPVSVVGVWRIWFEHPGMGEMVQGKPVPIPDDSNPAHVFEIHPITSFAGDDLRDSFQEIRSAAGAEYEAYDAETAFKFYEDDPATLQVSDTAVMIEAGKAKYNYAQFYIELVGAPQTPIDDPEALIVLADVFSEDSSEEPVTASPKRMIFVKNTDPAKKLSQLPVGERLHVLGIPRVSLAEVVAITATHGHEPVEVNLPYEMIIVAVLPD